MRNMGVWIKFCSKKKLSFGGGWLWVSSCCCYVSVEVTMNLFFDTCSLTEYLVSSIYTYRNKIIVCPHVFQDP